MRLQCNEMWVQSPEFNALCPIRNVAKEVHIVLKGRGKYVSLTYDGAEYFTLLKWTEQALICLGLVREGISKSLF